MELESILFITFCDYKSCSFHSNIIYFLKVLFQMGFPHKPHELFSFGEIREQKKSTAKEKIAV